MHRSSESVAALASALAKAQATLVNPEKSMTATIRPDRGGQGEQTFRYAPLATGLDIVRKTLSQHEIAVIQTTATDQAAGIVNLSTILAHASGEWISSEWPVCPITDMAAPRRMGAALTYARRYALFTLVGIAGEDDMDAPDLNVGAPANCTYPSVVPPASAGTTLPAARSGDRVVDQHPGRNGKATAAAGRALLDAEPSAGLRDRLLTEIASLGAAEEAATWARHALGAKNRLRTTDAKLIEEAFVVRMTSFEVARDGKRTPPASAPSVITEPVVPDGEAPKGIDKSTLTFGEPRRHRDKTHLKFVASHPCMVCDRNPAEAHHLRFAQPRTLGRKVSDEFTVPLCRSHHREVHRVGDEATWWNTMGINPIVFAESLWKTTRRGVTPVLPDDVPVDRTVTGAEPVSDTQRRRRAPTKKANGAAPALDRTQARQ